MVAKQRRLAALQGAVVANDGLKAQYDVHMQALEKERDGLLKEKTGLLQVRRVPCVCVCVCVCMGRGACRVCESVCVCVVCEE